MFKFDWQALPLFSSSQRGCLEGLNMSVRGWGLSDRVRGPGQVDGYPVESP